jgi:hypothetical protein
MLAVAVAVKVELAELSEQVEQVVVEQVVKTLWLQAMVLQILAVAVAVAWPNQELLEQVVMVVQVLLSFVMQFNRNRK